MRDCGFVHSLCVFSVLTLFCQLPGAVPYSRAESGVQGPGSPIQALEGEKGEILSLWPVNGASPGATVKLWAQVRNSGDSPYSFSARVWFYVDGPNWTTNHWVGAVTLTGLESGADRWFSLSWTIPSTLPLGDYYYWAQAWTNEEISAWSNAQGFTVTKEGVPGKATLISPNGIVASTNPTYSWTAVSKATSYYLLVNDGAGAAKIQTWYTSQQAGCGSGTGNCSVTPTTALGKGSYQWWIQTKNGVGTGFWSDGMAFTAAGAGPPGKATLVSPNGTITSASPAYTWAAVSKATSYYLWVVDSTGAAKVQTWYTAQQAGCSSGTGNCTITPTTKLASGAAQWWIQTQNAEGYGPWSDGMAFTITGLAPGKATLISPKATVSASSPAYSWSAVSKATYYYLWVADAAGAVKVQTWYTAQQSGCGAGTGNCSVTPATALAAGSYQWWIQTWNSDGYGPWSDGLAFTIAGTGPPGKAALVSPKGTISSASPTYTWSAVPKATSYCLWITDSSGTTKLQTWYTSQQTGCSSGSGNCFIAPSLTLTAGSYQWWVQTRNAEGDGPWSDGLVFEIASVGPPGKAVALSPTGTITTTTPSYIWNAVPTATGYLLFASDSTMSGKVNQSLKASDIGCASGTGTCSYRPATVLAAGTCLWKVQAFNDYGSGPWSDEKSFVVASGPYGIGFVTVPSGGVDMGSTSGNSDEAPIHRVIISKAFQMGIYEITQGQWKAVMGSNPSNFSGDDNLPVERVSWDDIQPFLAKMNALNDGFRYRLPTEAEWEYACRAGTTGDHAGTLDEMAWYSSNSAGKTHPVGTKKPNAWGLYDMHGNVEEWTQDWYDSIYYWSSPQTDPQGPSSGLHRVSRGGGWNSVVFGTRSSYRGDYAPIIAVYSLGFRLVRTPQ